MPPKPTESTSAQRLPSLLSAQESGQSLPFHVAIADGGLEVAVKIKSEGDVDNLIQILQTTKPLLQNIYGTPMPDVDGVILTAPVVWGGAQR